MTIMAAACGVLIVVLGLLGGGRNPTEAQSATQITCLVGGLILCFVAVVLARLKALDRRLDNFETAPASQDDAPSDGRAALGQPAPVAPDRMAV